jgi:DNA-binding LacI/PurR family transcriptional regulator
VEHSKVDGFVLTRTVTGDRAAAYLKKKGLPFVAIGSSDDPDIVCVDQDNPGGCRELTLRLLASGMKRLALIGGDETHTITGIRKRAFEEAHREAGLEPDPDLMILGVLDSEKVDLAVRRCLDLKADCIVCMSDRLAGSILMRCSDLGIRIPEDIGIASYYGSSLLETASPGVTSVYFDETRLGEEAASLLLRMIEGEEVKGKVLEGYTIRMEKSTQMPDRDGGL